MEKLPTFVSQGEKETKDFNGQQFEVERPSSLSVADINPGDRVLITTESGNRYMLRRSKSAGGAIKIYNEKADGFKLGYQLESQGNIANVGNKFNFMVRLSQDKGREYGATSVTAIEIRRGIDDAIEKYARENENKGGGFGQMLAEGLKNRFYEKGTDSEDEDASFFDKYPK